MFENVKSRINTVKRVRATSAWNEIRLMYVLFKHKLDKRNVRLGFSVAVDGVKYRLVDLESLLIVSPRFEEYMSNYLSPVEGDVFLDVGAHIGKYSLRFAKSVGPKGKVVSVEPDPSNFRALVDGIRLNKFGNITAINVAAYDCDSDLPFYTAPDEGKTPGGWLFGKGGSSIKRADGRSVCRVKAKTVDSIVGDLGLNKVNYMKIDVEGAEYEVLKGARGTIGSFRPKIVMECTENLDAIVQMIKNLGYCSTLIAPNYYFLEPKGTVK